MEHALRVRRLFTGGGACGGRRHLLFFTATAAAAAFLCWLWCFDVGARSAAGQICIIGLAGCHRRRLQRGLACISESHGRAVQLSKATHGLLLVTFDPPGLHPLVGGEQDVAGDGGDVGSQQVACSTTPGSGRCSSRPATTTRWFCFPMPLQRTSEQEGCRVAGPLGDVIHTLDARCPPPRAHHAGLHLLQHLQHTHI